MKNNGNFAVSGGRLNIGFKLEVFLPAFYG